MLLLLVCTSEPERLVLVVVLSARIEAKEGVEAPVRWRVLPATEAQVPPASTDSNTTVEGLKPRPAGVASE